MTPKLLWMLLAIAPLAALPACATPVTYSAESIGGWIVDAETKQPIEGAVVLADWVLEGSTMVDFKFTRVGDLKILETITDQNGRFRFDAWGPITHWGRGLLTYMDPEIFVFKNGYEYQRLANLPTKAAIEGKAGPVRRSEWNGKKIELKRFTGTPNERLRMLEKAIPAFERREDYKQSRLLKAILAEKDLIPDSTEGKAPFFNNTVRRLLEGG